MIADTTAVWAFFAPLFTPPSSFVHTCDWRPLFTYVCGSHMFAAQFKIDTDPSGMAIKPPEPQAIMNVPPPPKTKPAAPPKAVPPPPPSSAMRKNRMSVRNSMGPQSGRMSARGSRASSMRPSSNVLPIVESANDGYENMEVEDDEVGPPPPRAKAKTVLAPIPASEFEGDTDFVTIEGEEEEEGERQTGDNNSALERKTTKSQPLSGQASQVSSETPLLLQQICRSSFSALFHATALARRRLIALPPSLFTHVSGAGGSCGGARDGSL